MDTEFRLPREWDSLPHWVKDELLSSSKDLNFYSWHIQKLMHHGENMKAVWQLLEKHRQSFSRKGPVYSLLCLLHQAACGSDPGLPRSDDDRQAINKAIQKHAVGFATQIERLGTGSVFESYPLTITNAVRTAARDSTENEVIKLFRESKDRIMEVLDCEEISSEARKQVATQLELLYSDVESELMRLFLDPRESMRAIAQGSQEWVDACGWNRNDIIWHIGCRVRNWFGRDHFATTATLVTAITGEEVSEGVVAGAMRRQKTLSLRKVKTESEDIKWESDRD